MGDDRDNDSNQMVSESARLSHDSPWYLKRYEHEIENEVYTQGTRAASVEGSLTADTCWLWPTWMEPTAMVSVCDAPVWKDAPPFYALAMECNSEFFLP